MGATFARSRTFVAGETLTATNLNGVETNILNNFTPGGMDDYSADVTTMRIVTDPYPASVESLATSLQGELERIRYVIAQITGETYWFKDPTQISRVAVSVAGTVDAITAVHSPTFTAWVDKMRGIFRAGGANTSTTPTFAPDGLAAKTLVKESLLALSVGNIVGAGHEVEWIYNATADKVIILNPFIVGQLVKLVKSQTGALTSTTAVIPFDDTIPQNTEGTEILTATITPKLATNILIVRVTVLSSGNSGKAIHALFQDSIANALAVAAQQSDTYDCVTTSFTHTMVAGTVNPITFKVRSGSQNGGTLYINGYEPAGTRVFGGVAATSITVEEVIP